MSFQHTCFGLLTRLTLLVLIVSVSVSLLYGSTNPQYLSIRLFHSLLTLRHHLFTDRDRPKLSANYLAFEDLLRLRPNDVLDPLDDPLSKVKQLRLSLTMKDLLPKPFQCRINPQQFHHDGHQVQTFWVNQRTDSQQLLIYLHGGVYSLGDIQSYSGLECHLSQLFNVTLLHVEYRLSPEHPLPAAVEDTVALYRSLLREKISPSQIVLMGDSAGGGLALLSVQSLINHGLPVPRGVIVLSPWADLSASGESYRRNLHRDVLISPDKFQWLIEHIVGSSSPNLTRASSPIFSPLFGSFKGFPPVYINVGTAELLEDDSRRLVEKLRQSNVSVKFEVGEHLMHVYPIFYPYFPEAQNTLRNIERWIRRTFSSQLK